MKENKKETLTLYRGRAKITKKFKPLDKKEYKPLKEMPGGMSELGEHNGDSE